MAKKSGTRGAQGGGTIRKKTVSRSGKEYTYWEARITVGHDPGTGKQIQKSFSGKTQKEVREKMQAAAVTVNEGTYKEPSKMTVAQWLDIWVADYLNGVKPYTIASYTGIIRNHIIPALGAIRLEALNTHTIQRFYNSLSKPNKGKPTLSPKTVKTVHSILHNALRQSVKIGYIHFNPADACTLPRIVKKEMQVLDEAQIKTFLEAIRGNRYETLFTVTLFTGMREGEVMGLTWDCVNFNNGTFTINKQLQREKKKGGTYIFAPLKNDKARVITPAPWVMQLLRIHKEKQSEQIQNVGDLWENSGLVFTNEIGHHLAFSTLYKHFKTVVANMGLPDIRFHDLRHSYAVASIRSGDDIKTIQSNLGHATAAFTLDVYGHVTDQMKQASSERMEQYIKDILNL